MLDGGDVDQKKKMLMGLGEIGKLHLGEAGMVELKEILGGSGNRISVIDKIENGELTREREKGGNGRNRRIFKERLPRCAIVYKRVARRSLSLTWRIILKNRNCERIDSKRSFKRLGGLRN